MLLTMLPYKLGYKSATMPRIRRGETYHDHDVKLLGLGNKLHRGVVDNHRVESNTSVSVLLLGDSLACVEEKTISELHNVGLVDTSDFLAESAQVLVSLPMRPQRDSPFGCS